MDITQPSFTKSVGGYASYLAYPLDGSKVAKDFEVRFHFSTDNFEQVALLFFLGQDSLHEFGTEYAAISYVKGHVLFTWDLGAGFAKKAIIKKAKIN